MTRRRIRAVRFGILSVVLVFVAVAGCKKSEPTVGNQTPPPGMAPPSPGPTPQDVFAKLPGGEEFAAGKKVYADNNCARCHKMGDVGGGGGSGGPPGMAGGPAGISAMGGPPGPDLTKVGAAPEHTKEWLTAHVRDAKKHKPESRMPPFGSDKISDADLAKLVDYLASRK